MELHEIKHNLNKNQYEYFSELQTQIDTPLYFIGSITRSDYIKDKSDIDIEVFTDNILSTKLKVEYLFNYYEKNIENKIIVFDINNVSFSGYKYFFRNNKKDVQFDFTLYKTECKKNLLYHRNIETNLPLSISMYLFIIKFLYYRLHIINKNTFSFLKKCLWKFYNPDKSISVNYSESEYKDFYNKAHPNIKYMITPSRNNYQDNL